MVRENSEDKKIKVTCKSKKRWIDPESCKIDLDDGRDNIFHEIEITARDQLIKHIKTFKLSSYLELPSEWAEENRVLPQGVSARPGRIDHSIAPHMVEICDCAHPDSGVRMITIMKSTQSLATTTVEHVIGWAIKNKLHNILYIISTKGIARMRSSAAIDVLIDYSGLAQFVKPISSRMKRKTADNTFYKEFDGGYRLMMTSWNSIADAKSFSWDLIIMDELDEAPAELKGQGDPEELFSFRGITARNLKIFKLSTPTTEQNRINQNFLAGDQRYYFCRCPLCGERQVLTLLIGGRDYGLFGRTETIDNVEQIIPETIRYKCKACKGDLYEYQKQEMLQSGLWVPTARPISNDVRSYHINNLMSPIAFFSWAQVLEQYCKTDWGQNITKFKSFQINILGLPWSPKTEKKDWEDLRGKAEEYRLGEMPAGALIPVAGCDVQKRWIECVVVAYGRDLESWVVDHKQFHAETETKNRNDRCWADWQDYIRTKKFKLKNIEVPIAVTAIDSGYNPNASDNPSAADTDITREHTVYEIVARTPRTIACRGNYRLKDCIIKEEQVKRGGPLKRRFETAVNEMKDEIFVKVDLPPGAQGGMHFSRELSDEFFRGFMSEVYSEYEPGKWRYEKFFDRNEPLDCWILTRAGAEFLNLPTWTGRVWDEYELRLFEAKKA